MIITVRLVVLFVAMVIWVLVRVTEQRSTPFRLAMVDAIMLMLIALYLGQ